MCNAKAAVAAAAASWSCGKKCSNASLQALSIATDHGHAWDYNFRNEKQAMIRLVVEVAAGLPWGNRWRANEKQPVAR